MVWQKRIPDRFPDVSVTIASDADIIEAVKVGAFARGMQCAPAAIAGFATSLRDAEC